MLVLPSYTHLCEVRGSRAARPDPPSPLLPFLVPLSLSGAIDLIPKFIIASGELTKILIHTDVLRYLEFKQIAGSFVYRDGRISKVPSTEMEAVRSSLMGLFEKRRAKKFFEFVQGWKDDDPVTHQGEFEEVGLGGQGDGEGGGGRRWVELTLWFDFLRLDLL